MIAAPGSLSPDPRLPIVCSCREHKRVGSQNGSIINPVGFIYKNPTGAKLSGDFPDEFLAGAPLATERKQFDLNKGTVHFERRFSDGRLREKSLEVPKDTLAVEGIAGVLRFLPFDRITSFPVHLLSNEPRVYSISFENRGKEHVRTPAGEFDCYKLEMVPHLGVLSVVRHFYSKAFFWFTVAPPHFWVRYEGPENGPGTPEIVMELDRDSH